MPELAGPLGGRGHNYKYVHIDYSSTPNKSWLAETGDPTKHGVYYLNNSQVQLKQTT